MPTKQPWDCIAAHLIEVQGVGGLKGQGMTWMDAVLADEQVKIRQSDILNWSVASWKKQLAEAHWGPG